MITETNTAIDTNTSVQNPLGLKKIHHVEFYVGNAKQAEFYYRKAFGFSRAAYSGLETGNRETTSYLMRQVNINFVLTTPLSPEHQAVVSTRRRSNATWSPMPINASATLPPPTSSPSIPRRCRGRQSDNLPG